MRKHLVLLYDVEWQTLRVSCLQKNSATGGWVTAEGVTQNLERMRAYLLQGENDPAELQRRRWRVLNALNAVRMGYSGQQRFHTSLSGAVQQLRDEVSDAYKASKVPLTYPGTADTFEAYEVLVRRQLAATTLKQLLDIQRNLQTRNALHQDRPELNWFLGLMRERWVQSAADSMPQANQQLAFAFAWDPAERW